MGQKCPDILSPNLTKKPIKSGDCNNGDIKSQTGQSEVCEPMHLVQDGVFVVPEKPGAAPSSSRAVINIRAGQTRSDSEASSIQMEVDENNSCNEKGGNTDIDSGIENMEVMLFF